VVVPDQPTFEHLLSECRPDVAVVDLLLHELAGFTAFQAIKRLAPPGVPVLALLPGATESEWQQAQSPGADDAVVFPYTIEVASVVPAPGARR
jgi:DNA-binding response OmpR family regulator